MTAKDFLNSKGMWISREDAIQYGLLIKKECEELNKNNQAIDFITDDMCEKKFDEFRKLYPGSKGGLKVEFLNFKKKHKDYKQEVDKLYDAVCKLMENYSKKDELGIFRPPYKNLSTWINKRCWEDELEPIVLNKKSIEENQTFIIEQFRQEALTNDFGLNQIKNNINE